MNKYVRRVFVEKKKGFDVEARSMYRDLRQNLGIKGLKSVRNINRYDVSGISDEEYQRSRNIIFSEPPVDMVYDETIDAIIDKKRVQTGITRLFAIEYLPGQYDQRADSTAQCIQILTQGERPDVRVAKLIVLDGEISDVEFDKIRNYCINPVECREASLEKPATLGVEAAVPEDVKILHGFIHITRDEAAKLYNEMGFAMSPDDLEFCRDYFRDVEKRDPSVTEIRMIDTYWSDHCRHTTFMTSIHDVEFEKGPYTGAIMAAYESYMESRKYVYGSRGKDVCLMDVATIAMKELKKKGKLADLDESDEINACSIVVEVDVKRQADAEKQDAAATAGVEKQQWLVMFKNETHNHPTEIEPFGGAATCLGGAIRDPLSGRVYVYQAMRVTGSGDPRTGVENTIPGKLPQRKITTGAAAGYSSYGNQIGLATGQVAEVYDEGFVAKRMEIGAVIGAAPRENVVRAKPEIGDVIILLGGRTGRDGCGGATGSSKEHTEESLLTCGAEVQKGNPPTERKIQRLFRNPHVSAVIRKCNDFGAGGVSVAIGELAPGLDINLDAVPKKYEGLDGTELAISESQERMAVVVSRHDAEAFIKAANEENLEAVVVAVVTDNNRLKMKWRSKTIVDISRDFLDTNGVKQNAKVTVKAPDASTNFFNGISDEIQSELPDLKQAWLKNLQRLNVCSQKGLAERFDSTIGAGTVLMPFGGKYQLTPAESMVAKIPVLDGDTGTGTVMSYGYNPLIAKWSPFHGAVYSIVESVAKVVAAGADYKRTRLTLQEYFEKLGKDPGKWGKPFSALLGAYYAQINMGIPAIGGKDSMSGTFRDLTVPPTLVSFALDVVDVNRVISPEFKKAGSSVVLIPLRRDKNELPDFKQLDRNYTGIYEIIGAGKVLAAHTVRWGGLSEAISKMCFGNMIGFAFDGNVEPAGLFAPGYGSIILEIPQCENVKDILAGLEYRVLGHTLDIEMITVNGIEIDLNTALEKWEEPLEKIFPTRTEVMDGQPESCSYNRRGTAKLADSVSNTAPASASIDSAPVPSAGGVSAARLAAPGIGTAKPRIFIPVFPGTNCEYDTAKAFEKAGGLVDIMVVRNLSAHEIEESIELMVKKIENSRIIMIPGGFSGGDEPDGSGKFIATAFRNPRVKDAVTRLLKQRDGLMLGICNGFQALIKLGLVPYGEIRDITGDSPMNSPGDSPMNNPGNSPTLTFNTIGRHASCMVRTRVASTLSPWFANVDAGDIHTIAISHGEGRFVANTGDLEIMAANGQIATQYVDLEGKPTYDIRYNPNGSVQAVEGITSPDGRVLGKMGHSERIGSNVAKNVPGEKDQKIFDAGIKYFK